MTRLTSTVRLMLALSAMLVLAGLGSVRAHADSYGELGSIGSAGKGQGEFKFSTTKGETSAFGVEPGATVGVNNVYVGDEPKPNEYRIQKFSINATGESKFLAEVKVKPASVEGFEGIAVDPVEHRVYALALFGRENHALDGQDSSAGTLYAFSTEPVSGKLVPAEVGGKSLPGGVLAGPTALNAESDTLGAALLKPGGIAVDPVTHDVIILGQQDLGETEEEEETLRVALERVHTKGEGEVGPRWLDEKNCFGGEGSEACEADGSSLPSSPVVTKAGKVFVRRVSEIDEIPSDFTSKLPPQPLFTQSIFNANHLQKYVVLPNFSTEGASLSLAPDDGTFWSSAKIRQVEKGELGFEYPGAAAITPAGKEEGWIGGQSPASGGGKCTINFSGYPLVAAGKERFVFALDTSVETPHVAEFGPSGKGCLLATAGPLTASVKGGPPVTEAPAGTTVTLSAPVVQANAMSVKWQFKLGAGAAEEVAQGEPQYQTTKLEHVFSKAGEYTITETISTDDFATPTLVVIGKLKVGAATPTAQFSAEVGAAGAPTHFDAGSSSDPNGSSLVLYQWSFGDGETLSTAASSVSHTYAAAGNYLVTLKVTDALTLTSPPHSMEIAVSAPPPPGGGGGGGGGGTGTGTGTTPPPPPGGGGSGGVLSYKVSVASTALTVSRSGTVGIKVNCSGQSSCSGSVTLRTLTAVAARAKHKSILTLASGSFSLSGGQAKLVTLHLSAKAKKLLARMHTLRVGATIVAHDSKGVTHTTHAVLTLHAAKSKH